MKRQLEGIAAIIVGLVLTLIFLIATIQVILIGLIFPMIISFILLSLSFLIFLKGVLLVRKKQTDDILNKTNTSLAQLVWSLFGISAVIIVSASFFELIRGSLIKLNEIQNSLESLLIGLILLALVILMYIAIVLSIAIIFSFSKNPKAIEKIKSIIYNIIKSTVGLLMVLVGSFLFSVWGWPLIGGMFEGTMPPLPSLIVLVYILFSLRRYGNYLFIGRLFKSKKPVEEDYKDEKDLPDLGVTKGMYPGAHEYYEYAGAPERGSLLNRVNLALMVIAVVGFLLLIFVAPIVQDHISNEAGYFTAAFGVLLMIPVILVYTFKSTIISSDYLGIFGSHKRDRNSTSDKIAYYVVGAIFLLIGSMALTLSIASSTIASFAVNPSEHSYIPSLSDLLYFFSGGILLMLFGAIMHVRLDVICYSNTEKLLHKLRRPIGILIFLIVVLFAVTFTLAFITSFTN